jgi:hypothetical protein
MTTATDHQDRQRTRRRHRLPLTYDGRFDLVAEVAAICEPVAQRVAAEPRPTTYTADVADVGDAVHELVCVAVGLQAERAADRKAGHLPVDQRGRTKRALCDLAKRPGLPVIERASLADGGWSAQLAAYAAPFAADLADLLAHAKPPGTRRGLLSASERVEHALWAVDQAVVNLAKRLDFTGLCRAQRQDRTEPTAADRVRAELAALGVTP